MTEKTFAIPENLDLDLLMSEHPPESMSINKGTLLYLINLIFQIPAYNKKIRENLINNNGYVPLNSTMLRKAGIRYYKEYLSYLIILGILETDNRYTKNKSRGYRFTSQFLTKPKIVKIEVKKSIYKQLLKRDFATCKKYPYLAKWFDPDKLHIDHTAAIEHLERKFVIDLKEDRQTAAFNHYVRLIQIAKLKNNDYLFFQDPLVRRLTTNLTGLPSDLRRYISYDGKPLVAVDVKNSTPFFSSMLFDLNFLLNKKSGFPGFFSFLGDLLPSFFPISAYTRYVDTNYKYYTCTTYIYPKTFPPPPSFFSLMLAKLKYGIDKQSIKEYGHDVVAGGLYEKFQQAFKEETGKGISRSDAKEMIFGILYSENGQMKNKKKIFEKLYPGVHQIFTEIKQDDYKLLSYLLMRIESYMVLDVVSRKISKMYPDVPIFTIHDCIVTTNGNEQEVKRIFEEEVEIRTGAKPPLEIEYFN